MGVGDSGAEEDHAYMARDLPLAGDGRRRIRRGGAGPQRPRCCVELSPTALVRILSRRLLRRRTFAGRPLAQRR
ncbi:ethylene-responsive transcription factor erf025 [Phtheirospermum japonicum]|uniref:Ethylene-responsive transcription factor erf025 n=1 Tax=Phtheirospermum japonicum TaxID=374723 RepID=A0A830CAG1_9LAMI|nr:ethylene-responsive transcription factor erf025 [Phtheirospermum japonicum]